MLGGSKVPFMHYMHIKSRGRCPEIFEFSHNLLRTDNLPASFAKFFFGLSPEPLRLLPNDIHRKLLLMHQKFLVKIRIPYIVLILG